MNKFRPFVLGLAAVFSTLVLSCSQTETFSDPVTPTPTPTKQYEHYSFNTSPAITFYVTTYEADSFNNIGIVFRLRYQYQKSYTTLGGVDTTVYYDRFTNGFVPDDRNISDFNTVKFGSCDAYTAFPLNSISCGSVDKGTKVRIFIQDVTVYGRIDKKVIKQNQIIIPDSYSFGEGEDSNCKIDLAKYCETLW
jgi:hypothetical protein